MMHCSRVVRSFVRSSSRRDSVEVFGRFISAPFTTRTLARSPATAVGVLYLPASERASDGEKSMQDSSISRVARRRRRRQPAGLAHLLNVAPPWRIDSELPAGLRPHPHPARGVRAPHGRLASLGTAPCRTCRNAASVLRSDQCRYSDNNTVQPCQCLPQFSMMPEGKW